MIQEKSQDVRLLDVMLLGPFMIWFGMRSTGNACPVGTTNEDVIIRPSFPIKSTTANTATTIVCPAIGATGICRIHAIFYTGF